MSFYKLQKVKKYLNENLFKEFITFSKASYFSSVLFALKANKDLWFCIDYQKLNAIIKRNRYSLLLINKMIEKIVDCKHLTWLNIISTFNKLRMHSDSENYIIFIIALEAYKLKMLSFELINDFVSFQQYMNNILWNFLNDFCQVYLMLQMCQNWLKLVNDLVKIWSKSDSDLTQIWLSIFSLL